MAIMAHIRHKDFDLQADHKFYEFYKAFINNKFDLKLASFQLSVKEILDSHKDLFSTKDRRNYEKPSYQWSRLLQLAIHHACLVMQRFYEFLKECPGVMEDFVYKKRIRMCCLGDGLALEAILVSKLIDKALIQFGFRNTRRTKISVKVVCRDERWKLMYKRLVRKVNKQLKKVSLRFDFYSNEFIDSFPRNFQKILKKAHVVTSVEFLSSLSSFKTEENIMKNTLENMRKKGILFYLDTETENDYQALSSMTEKCDPCSEVYFSSSKFHLQNEVLNVNDNSDFDAFLELAKNDVDPTICSTWIKAFTRKITHGGQGKLKAVRKTSTGLPSNRIRNSTKKFKLEGKFSRMDMEKKNKTETHRRKAFKASVSRYASFDDDY